MSNLSTNLYLKLDTLPGGHVRDAFNEMRKLALQLGIVVGANLNGFDAFVFADTDIEELYEMYCYYQRRALQYVP